MSSRLPGELLSTVAQFDRTDFMTNYRIESFEGRADVLCADEAELLRSLLEMAKSAFAYPTLVNVYGDFDRVALIGLGTGQSTLQLADLAQGISHRAISDNDGGVSFEFAYNGEATFIRPRYLIPQDPAIRAVVKWLSAGELASDLKWTSGPYPPVLVHRPLMTDLGES